MRNLISALAATFALLATPAFATVIGTLQLGNGVIQYDGSGGLSLPGLSGTNYYATIAGDYNLDLVTPPTNDPADYVLDVNVSFLFNNQVGTFNHVFALGVDTWDELSGISDQCFDSNLSGNSPTSGSLALGIKADCTIPGIGSSSDIDGSGTGTDVGGSVTLRTVPEPGTLALLGLGLLAAGVAVRRRKAA